MVSSLIKIDIINKIFERALIDKMLINYRSKISKDALNYKIVGFDRVKRVSRDYRNSEDNIRSNIKYSVYKKVDR